MEMACVLDKCIGEFVRIGSSTQEEDIQKACDVFTTRWKPEAEALCTLAFDGLDLRKFSKSELYGMLVAFKGMMVHILFKGFGLTNAKSAHMSYSAALKYEVAIDRFLLVVLFLFLSFGGYFLMVNYLGMSPIF
jgi:hypothetical protein